MSKQALEASCPADANVNKGPNQLLNLLRNKRILNLISILSFLGIWDLLVLYGFAPLSPGPLKLFSLYIRCL